MGQPKISDLRTFITNWKISQPLLASKTGVRENTFSNKLAARQHYYFSSEEEMTLINVMAEMQKQLNMIMSGISIMSKLKPMERSSKKAPPPEINPKKPINQFMKRKNQEPIPGDILDTAPVMLSPKKTTIAEAKVIPRGYRPLKNIDEYDF